MVFARTHGGRMLPVGEGGVKRHVLPVFWRFLVQRQGVGVRKRLRRDQWLEASQAPVLLVEEAGG